MLRVNAHPNSVKSFLSTIITCFQNLVEQLITAEVPQRPAQQPPQQQQQHQNKPSPKAKPAPPVYTPNSANSNQSPGVAAATRQASANRSTGSTAIATSPSRHSPVQATRSAQATLAHPSPTPTTAVAPHLRETPFTSDEDAQIRSLLRRLQYQGGSRIAATTELSRRLHRSAESVLARADALLDSPQSSKPAASPTVSISRKRSASPTSAVHQAPPTKRSAPTTSALMAPPYTPQEIEVLTAELLTALERGAPIGKNSEVAGRLSQTLGRSEAGIVHKLTTLRRELAPRHVLTQPHTQPSAADSRRSHDLTDAQGQAGAPTGHGRPYTAEEIAVLRTECRRAVALGTPRNVLLAQLSIRLNRTLAALQKKLQKLRHHQPDSADSVGTADAADDGQCAELRQSSGGSSASEVGSFSLASEESQSGSDDAHSGSESGDDDGDGDCSVAGDSAYFAKRH